MKPFMHRASTLGCKPLLAALLLLTQLPAALAQSYCASDGQPQPVQLMERFINANCDSCWTDPATPVAGKGVLALDWIVPGDLGDDAPLSAAATRDALTRLQTLGEAIPAATATRSQALKAFKGSRLRVAHGLPVADYLGTSIELKPIPAAAKGQRWSAWLALVETLPAGTEGSPIERNLVRNLLQQSWDGRIQLSKTERNRFFEARSMAIAPAANPNRLRVIGWVENEAGQVLAAAQSRCKTP
ncbi:hypothetical protein SAMN05216344_11886 [Polaromonas sp. OV174]|uniref:hypothetical protein n=1 Tax=Polaromonas sp. OV174 TaxID=1855300 RepID=UPI0008DF23DB|nr:hypothetical protein [Polaromonas sp. OV174]SFC47090.1 hypothetical protein SAMN05216344_11886 [Polaromonas sp. OV174]